MSPFPDQKSAVVLRRASNCDLEDMIAIRIEAMRESLERLGRFDPMRVRERLRSAFEPACMRHILISGERVGYLTLIPHTGSDSLRLHHLYIRPTHQGHGVGAWALEWVGDVLGLLCCLVLAWYGTQATWASYAAGSLSIKTLVTPEWWSLAPLPVVFVLLSIEMVFRMHRLLHAERGPRQDAVSAA